MSKSNVHEAAWLDLIFFGNAFPDIAQNDVSSPATTLSVALHTADPGEGGNQSTNEIVYTGYVRKAVPRSAAGWARLGNVVSPFVNIDFGQMTGGAGGTVTHWSVGTGVGNVMLYKGPRTPNIVVVIGEIPRIKTTSTITEE